MYKYIELKTNKITQAKNPHAMQ